MGSISLEQSIPLRAGTGITAVHSSQGFSPRTGNGNKSYSLAFTMEGVRPAGLHHPAADGGQGCDEDPTNRRLVED